MTGTRTAACACLLTAVATVLAVVAPTPANAQGQTATRPGLPEARPTKPPPPTAVIRGRVTAFGSQSGVRQARVALNGGQRSTSTDNQGLYEFKQLPAGRYIVSVTKAPFLTVEYAQRAPREPGRTIDLGDGQVADNIDVVLPRACVVGGTIFDDLGEPAEQVRVAAMRVERTAAGARLSVVGTPVRTNDLGQYRIPALPPGRYYIGTPPPVADSVPPPVADRAFRATYYPGTSDFAEALPITVDVGQQALDVNFALWVGRAVRVSGRVVNRGRGGGGWSVQATQSVAGGAGSFAAETAGVRPDGTFTIGPLGAGDYTLLVIGKDPDTGMDLCGSAAVIVGTADVEGIVVSMTPTASISGSVALQPSAPTSRGSTLPRLADVMETLRIVVDAMPDSPVSPSPTTTTGTFGRFEIKNLVPARVRFRVTGLPTGWLLDSISYLGRDVTDTPLDVRGSIGGVLVTLTDRGSEVSGTVTDAAGRPATDYLVVVFPENQALRDRQRLLVTARPDQNGRFVVRGLPRGSYFAFAVERLVVDDPFDAAYLEGQRREATRFSLLKGETKTLDLTLAR